MDEIRMFLQRILDELASPAGKIGHLTNNVRALSEKVDEFEKKRSNYGPKRSRGFLIGMITAFVLFAAGFGTAAYLPQSKLSWLPGRLDAPVAFTEPAGKILQSNTESKVLELLTKIASNGGDEESHTSAIVSQPPEPDVSLKDNVSTTGIEQPIPSETRAQLNPTFEIAPRFAAPIF